MNSWKFLEILENSRKFLKILENSWKFLKSFSGKKFSYRTVLNFLENIWFYLKAERAAERKANRPERKERKRLKREKREKRKAEEGPAIVEMTKKILSMDLKPKQNIDLETLEAELRENATTGGRSRLYAIMVIFRGFRIVQKVNWHCFYCEK